MIDFPAVHHLALTLTDPEASRDWYQRLLDRRAALDELRPGLDHVSFGCADRSQLEQWQARPGELGVEHGGIAEDAQGLGLSSATRTVSPWSSGLPGGEPAQGPEAAVMLHIGCASVHEPSGS